MVKVSRKAGQLQLADKDKINSFVTRFSGMVNAQCFQM